MTVAWVEHPDLGATAQVPDEALPAFVARGWVVCDPQPEPETVVASAPRVDVPVPVRVGPVVVERRAEVAPAYEPRRAGSAPTSHQVKE